MEATQHCDIAEDLLTGYRVKLFDLPKIRRYLLYIARTRNHERPAMEMKCDEAVLRFITEYLESSEPIAPAIAAALEETCLTIVVMHERLDAERGIRPHFRSV
jgi:hypothetical protein